MTTRIQDWLGNLSLISDDEISGHRNWGFTIYRTGYGPSSDEQWQQLLQRIKTKAYNETLEVTETTPDDPEFQQLWSLFWLDSRSDPSLDSLDVDRLRQLYNTGEGGKPMNTDYKLHRVFLFADDWVLSDPAAATVKCVDADYRAEDYIPRSTRVGGQRYFGWMQMTIGSVTDLWVRLDHVEMSQIAPGTIGGDHLIVWDGSDL